MLGERHARHGAVEVMIVPLARPDFPELSLAPFVGFFDQVLRRDLSEKLVVEPCGEVPITVRVDLRAAADASPWQPQNGRKSER